MTEPLYPKGTIVRFTFGPLGVVESINTPGVPKAVRDENGPDGWAIVWAGDEGIYVGPIETAEHEWHLVMVDKGDVPVHRNMIQSHPAHEDKNKALLTDALVADSEQYRGGDG